MNALATRILMSLTDVVFPPRCISCNNSPGSDSTIPCPLCSHALSLELGGEACPRCSRSIAPFEVIEALCSKCRHRRPRVLGTVRVGIYGRHLGRLVRAYKYAGREELEPLLGGWLASAVMHAPWLNRVEGIVFVPTHWRQRIFKPLHAAETLGAYVVRETGLPHLPILRRTRAGRSQVGLSRSQRIENVRGAFALRRGVILRNARLLVIDDTHTTGATIEECAKVLIRGGAKEVYAAVVAKTEELYRGTRRNVAPVG